MLTGQHNVGAPCVALALHPTSLLAAVACQQQGSSGAAVRVYDMGGKQLVRRFVMARQGGGGPGVTWASAAMVGGSWRRGQTGWCVCGTFRLGSCCRCDVGCAIRLLLVFAVL